MGLHDGLKLSPSLYHRYCLEQIVPDTAYDGGDVASWQKRLRPVLAQCMGFSIPERKTALNPRVLWKQEFAAGTVEKIVFSSEPCADVLAYVCLPRDVRPPYDWFICLQGHSTGMHNSIGVERDDEFVPKTIEGDRNFGIGCMERGIAALCIEQRSFGLRGETVQKQISTHMCHDAICQALMLGKTLAGERVYDVERGIDYLATRPDVNMDRIGVMGNSGGGTVSIYAAALLPRIAFCMPSCSFCTYAGSVMSIYHCGDNYIPGLLRHAESADVLGLFAPKPCVVVAGVEDDIFPIAEIRRAHAALRRIYAAGGAEDRLKLVEGPGGHRFYADIAWNAMLPLMGR